MRFSSPYFKDVVPHLERTFQKYYVVKTAKRSGTSCDVEFTYSIWNWAIGVRGVGYVTVYTYAVPIAGGIVAWILLGEALTLPQVGAGAVGIAGMLAALGRPSRDRACEGRRPSRVHPHPLHPPAPARHHQLLGSPP